MPTGAVLLAELPRPVEEAELARLRTEMEDFYVDGPFHVVRSRADGPVPTSGDERSTWIAVNLWRAYFSPEYPRGDITIIVRCAEWLEARLAGCRMWYGHDVDDDNLAPFSPERRRALLAHAKGIRTDGEQSWPPPV
jgi:hypothetical protein